MRTETRLTGLQNSLYPTNTSPVVADQASDFAAILCMIKQAFAVARAEVIFFERHRDWLRTHCGTDFVERLRFVPDDDASADGEVSHRSEARAMTALRSASGSDGMAWCVRSSLQVGCGSVVGALVLEDPTDRTLREEQLKLLAAYADIIVEKLEHRRTTLLLSKWDHVFQRAPWGIALADGDNPTLDMMNSAFAVMHGSTIEELQGRPIAEVFAESCRSELEHHARTVQEKGHHIYESLHLRKDGTTFPVLIDAWAIRNGEGKLLYRAAHVQDITKRRQAEERIHRSNVVLRVQQETSLDGILVVGPEGQFLSYNQRFVRMWNLPDHIMQTGRDELALEFVTDRLLKPHEFIARVRDLYDHPGESSFDEIALRDGRVFERYSAPMIDTDGRNHGRVWYFRDVTERIKAERLIRESEERISRILESAMDAIVTIDERRTVTLFNRAAEAMFRIPATEAMGTSIDTLLSPEFGALISKSEQAFRRSSSSNRYMWAPDGLTARRRDGEAFPVEATVSHCRSGESHLLTLILRDVNDRQRAEATLRQLQAENVYLREEAGRHGKSDAIVGESAILQATLDDVARVAKANSTVLISGETGTGKELIARAIHEQSHRKDRLLIKVNCAALPAGLIESELFGHEKGAFTSAVSRKIGRFEMAHLGTIFLDEIGDLPAELQAKLLRVLQEGEFERVGGFETLRCDLRVIAATNRNLEEDVRQQRFRADLYYRLNVFPIRVPALRERVEDIPLLVSHFATKYAARMGKRIEKIPDWVMSRMSEYTWPGNVRELQNVVERAVITSRGPNLELGDWLPRTTNDESRGPRETLDDVQRHHILEVLESTHWRVSGKGGAAERLGLKPTTLEARMKKLGITRRK